MDDQSREEREALERMLIDSSAVPTKLSYAVIKHVTKNFSEQIGRGGFGEVFLGTLRNGKIAVKKLLSSSLDFDDKLFMDEVQCLVRAKHKHIVRFLGYCAETQGELMEYNGEYIMAHVRLRLLCFEYVPNGSLDRHLQGKFYESDWSSRYRMIRGICLGLQYLHNQRITHLDLKPENVLLDAHMDPKIADFGLSRCFNDKQSRIVTKVIRGTRGYTAPELIDNGEISFKSDIYSLGIVMQKLLARRATDRAENLNKSLDMECIPMKKCIAIAQSCVDADQHKRPDIDKIIVELNDIETMTENAPPVVDGSKNAPGSSIYQTSPSGSRELIHVHPGELYYPSGLNKLMSYSLQLTNMTDDHVAFMFTDSGKAASSSLLRKGLITPQSTLGVVLHLEMKAGEQAVTDQKHCKDMVHLRCTIARQSMTQDEVSSDMFDEQKCGADVELAVVRIKPSSQPHSLSEEVDKLQLVSGKGSGDPTTLSCPGSIKTELLEIYPLELRFPFEPDTYIHRAIHLTNTTDDDISFWVIPSNPRRYLSSGYYCRNTVSPQSTCALTMYIYEGVKPQSTDYFEILMATSRSLSHLDLDGLSGITKRVFDGAREKGGKAHTAYLLAAIQDPDPASQIPAEHIDMKVFGEIKSIDVHPLEPRILTGHSDHVCIWKGGLEEVSLEKSQRYFGEIDLDFVVKFITRRHWVLSGDIYGIIRVFTTTLDLVHTFTANKGRIRSLAVHPSLPYVLSSSDDYQIKLWDWDQGWTCIREFGGHSGPVTQVVFNPNTNTFASVSGPFSDDGPGNVKIWSIDSTVCETYLPGQFKAVDYSAIVDGNQYIVAVTNDKDGKAEVWDLLTESCVHTHEIFWTADSIVVCHPTLPLMFTGTEGGSIYIRNLATYRLEYSSCYSAYGPVTGFGFLNIADNERLVVGYSKAVMLLEIDMRTLAFEGRILRSTQQVQLHRSKRVWKLKRQVKVKSPLRVRSKPSCHN